MSMEGRLGTREGTVQMIFLVMLGFQSDAGLSVDVSSGTCYQSQWRIAYLAKRPPSDELWDESSQR